MPPRVLGGKKGHEEPNKNENLKKPSRLEPERDIHGRRGE